MKIQEWLNTLLEKGLVCEQYAQKIECASSKAQLINLLLDANGASFLCEMDAKGFPLPYETILRDFNRFVNGNYIASYQNSKGNGYTSSFYCCYIEKDKLEINTTQTLLFCCTLDVFIKENDFVKLFLDKRCDVRVHCPKSARCIVHYWKGAKIEVMDNYHLVELIEEA